MGDAVKLVEAERADGIFMGQVVTNYLMNEVMKQPGILVFDDKLPNASSEYSLATVKHTELVKQFDEFLSTGKDTVARLKSKHKVVE